MDRPYNIALILIRFFGFIGVAFGVMWLVNVIATLAVHLLGAPDWLTEPLWHMASQALLSGPIWALTGLLILKYSGKLAAFVARGSSDN